MKIAIYPGSFDPIHEGHISIIKKAIKLFDKVIVVVSNNLEKKNQTPIEIRYEKIVKLNLGIEVIVNANHLTAEIAKKHGAKWIIRSGRDNIDFKYELEMASANNHLNNEIETILIIPNYENISYKSRLIKQGVKKW